MANYDVDIRVALEGAQKITALSRNIKALNKEITKINKIATHLGKETDKAFRVDSVRNYSRALNQAERALRNVASGTDAERRAVERVVRIRREANDALARQNRLLAQAAANQREVIATANAGFGMQGPSLPRGFFKAQGPKLPPGFTEAGRKPRGVSRSSTDRIGAAVSAGAFPLLFGGGPGMALGGALGGAISGSTFGPASIALQVLGGALDQFAASAATTGQALNPLTADVNAVAEAAGYASTPFQQLLVDLESSGDAAKALRLATELMSITVGADGVEALQDFGADTLELGNEFQKAMAIMQAAVAALINRTGILKGITDKIEKGILKQQITRSINSDTEEGKRLRSTLRESPGQFSRFRGSELTPETFEMMRKINKEKEKNVQLNAKNTKLLLASNTIAANNKKIAELDADLTNSRVYVLERSNIFQKAILKASKKGADNKLIELERDTQLLNLKNKRSALEEAAAEKAAAAIAREQRRLERLEKQKQRAIERAMKAVDREMERTDRAFERANSQLDDIINKHEDKMAFEREYSRLIKEGSTPAAAKQAVELKKQLLELDRQYAKLLDAVDAQILKTESSIADLKAQTGVTDEYKKQVEELDKLKKKRDELEGKKGKAKGAIEKDLAPETFEDKIKGEIEKVQGALNELLDPANQVIAAASAIGDAFSESFRGIVTGSMTAREALANLFQRTAEHFIDMATEMIAYAIKMKVLGIVLNAFGGAAAGGAADSFAGVQNSTLDSVLPSTESLADVAAATPLKIASGGYVSGPTRALVGEGGEPEYVIPQSKMRESMARYSRGARGSAVVPGSGDSGTSGEGGGTAVAAPIDVRFNVERINNVDYVTAEEFQIGMQKAAAQGAQRGQQLAMTRLQQSPNTRRRLGL